MMNLSPAYLKWKEETLYEGEQRGIQIGEQRGIQIGEQRGIQIGEQRGIQIGEQELALRLLRRKVGSLSADLETRIRTLPIQQLEILGEALLDFGSLSDLINWLATHEHPIEDSSCSDPPTP